ncbi:MAG: O-methyltransferase [Solirubrobacterales bacterium]
MTHTFTEMSAQLHRYAVEHSEGQDELLERLAQESDIAAGDLAEMRTGPEQATLMTLLVRAVGARRALELGTFTGYGSISIARGLPDDGMLVTCDVSEQWTAIATRYFEQAGLADRIDLRLGPALETLRALPESEPFDFAFIDADKVGYPDYYEECVRLLRPGGLVAIDNVFYDGEVVAENPELGKPESLSAIKQVNDRVVADERVFSVMLGIADGVTLALRL